MFRSIRQWFHAPKTNKRRNRRVLGFDVLEDRMVPAAYVVNVLDDPGPPLDPVKNVVSLRRAMEEVNRLGQASNSITFLEGLSGPITIAIALPPIGANVVIDAGSQGGSLGPRITVARSTAPETPEFNIFEVLAGKQFGLSYITITGGWAVSGGGMHVAATASANLGHVFVTSNRATFIGGGIYNQGTLTMEACTIEFNRADGSGGGIFNEGTLDAAVDIEIRNNDAFGSGGGILNDGEAWARINGAAIHDNWAAFLGGGISNRGELELLSSALFNNRADLFGGGIQCESGSQATCNSVEISNNFAINNGGTGRGGGFRVSANATATFTNCTLVGNTADEAASWGGWVSPLATYNWIGAAPVDPVLVQ